MYTLYIGNKTYSSWSLRPWLLMRELNISFEERLTPFEDGGSYQTFREFSPSGLVPCLRDQDTAVWDSMAITEYLAEHHTRVWPESPGARAWARSIAAEMHAGFKTLRNQCPMAIGLKVALAQRSAELHRDLSRLDEIWCYGLNTFGGPFLAGNRFTAADAFFAPVAFRIDTYGLTLSQPANDYARRLLSLAGMQLWARAALVEPYKDTRQEDQISRVGNIIEDRRTPQAER